MLANRDNWKIFIAALILGALPLLYAIFSSNFSWKKGLWSLFASIAGFGLVHSRVKAETVSLGRFIMIVNFALLFFLGVYLILGTLSLGSLIERTLIKFRNFGWQELFLTFGIGLC